jgi:NAD(P)-dependent dehydrogenase (short-subunit alcohol dehydrogenase family)
MQLNLNGQVAVITGGASGIGAATAVAFLGEGSHVAVWDRKPATNETQHHYCEVDITDRKSLVSAVESTLAKFGRIDHLVHAAAIGSGKYGFPYTNLSPDDWTEVLRINVGGMVEVAHQIGPLLRQQASGSMCFIGSIAAQLGSQTDPPYSASKAALINFAQCLAKDLAPHNVRVNVINPGMIQTELNRAVWAAWNSQQAPEEQRGYDDWGNEKVKKIIPLGRWQTVEDVANMAVFLASDRSASVTGQSINVDGGCIMRQ